MGIFGVIADLLGIGKAALNNRARLKQAKQDQEFKIVEAQTGALTDRIRSNTDTDNQIDIITSQNKKYTLKDEVVSYLFLTPLLVTNIIPFIVAFKTGQWTKLNLFFTDSYQALNLLPDWYKWGLGLVVIDILGFRSMVRPLIEKAVAKLSIIKKK